jgi:hypothetical protein
MNTSAGNRGRMWNSLHVQRFSVNSAKLKGLRELRCGLGRYLFLSVHRTLAFPSVSSQDTAPPTPRLEKVEHTNVSCHVVFCFVVQGKTRPVIEAHRMRTLTR